MKNTLKKVKDLAGLIGPVKTAVGLIAALAIWGYALRRDVNELKSQVDVVAMINLRRDVDDLRRENTWLRGGIRAVTVKDSILRESFDQVKSVVVEHDDRLDKLEGRKYLNR